MNRILIYVLAGVGALAATASVVAVVTFARGERSGPARCPDGMQALGARCCGEGQRLDDSQCVGKPTHCGPGMEIGTDACRFAHLRIEYAADNLELGPSDWEAQGVVQTRQTPVEAFALDATEVTVERWFACAESGVCAPISGEPGAPVRGVDPKNAGKFCRFEGGRLPSGDEWVYAAAGSVGRRFPWGTSGLVCRRAVFGLSEGPCGHGATGPDIVGSRPNGATPDGAQDMAGNVAEWTVEPDGRFVARGGSYRSRVAAELKSWAAENASPDAAHVGFRCAYDSGGTRE